MDHFNYKDGILYAENVSVEKIAKEVGTPVYIYSTATLERHYRIVNEALEGMERLICFAVKSNSNIAVLKTLADCGAGMDVVSGGEIRRALKAGVPGNKIVFSGVGKTSEEIRFALQNDIRQFNVESEEELLLLNQIAQDMGKIAPIALRVNPDVDAKTHAKISTGKSENKFGIPIKKSLSVYDLAGSLDHIEVVGVDVHIGSQLTDLEPYENAFTRIAELTRSLREKGHNIRRLDLGGGLGIPYARSNSAPPLPFDYGGVIKKTVGDLGCEITVEPGRLISGNAGILVASTVFVKQGEGRDFLILDAAMNDLIRPALYDAHHDIIPVLEPASHDEIGTYDVVGPVCETGDTFAKARTLPLLKAGDLVAFRSAGAYAAVMASEYNSRPLIPEVLVKDDSFSIIRQRPSYEEMLNRDILPEWMR